MILFESPLWSICFFVLFSSFFYSHTLFFVFCFFYSWIEFSFSVRLRLSLFSSLQNHCLFAHGSECIVELEFFRICCPFYWSLVHLILVFMPFRCLGIDYKSEFATKNMKCYHWIKYLQWTIFSILLWPFNSQSAGIKLRSALNIFIVQSESFRSILCYMCFYVNFSFNSYKLH